MQKTVLISFLLLTAILAACSLSGANNPTDTPTITGQSDEVASEATDTAEPEPPQEITPTICPQATPEWLRVYPVTSPTGGLTQTIYIDINNGESVTITTPAGEFEARQESGTLEDDTFRYNFIAEIDLLPNTEQELTVQTQIRQLEQGGCPYGGYPLTTKVDINFEPLIIIQESE